MASVFDLLDHEWRRLSRDSGAAAPLGEVCRLADGATTLADVERYVRAADPADADRVFIALVTQVVDGDALAARVLLQLLLPGTRSLARRWWALGDYDERAAAAVLAVYHRIRSYPLARRPGRIAANILFDAAHELRRAVPRLQQTLASDPDTHLIASRLEVQPPLNPAVELAEVLRDAVHDQIIDPDDAQLIARSRIAGDRVADIATHQGFRPRTLWDRRYRAEATLIRTLARPAVQQLAPEPA